MIGGMSILRRAAQPVRGSVRRAAGRSRSHLDTLIHAVKNELVGKFNHLDFRMDEVSGSLSSSHQAISDQLALQGARLLVMEQVLHQVKADNEALLAEIGASRNEIGFARKDLSERIAQVAPTVRLQELAGYRLAELDRPGSAFLNYSGSHSGPLADAGLWINHPVVVEWREGEARLGSVNERIIEQPFVFAALGDLELGARIVDIGGGESTVAFSLASLGYRVTVVEPQGYPFQHPNLTVCTDPLEAFSPAEPFEAVVLLSAIEHFGIGHYAGGPEPDSEADLGAMARVAELVAPGGRLVLTTPYGPARVTNVERIYDRERLSRLLSGWRLRSVAIGHRLDAVTWEIEATELVDPPGPDRVAMVVATRAEDS
jgi:Caenorhabditis protein of unknown function, DUF268